MLYRCAAKPRRPCTLICYANSRFSTKNLVEFAAEHVINGTGCTMLDAVWPSIVISLLVFPGREKMIAGVMPCCMDRAGGVSNMSSMVPS